MDRRCQLTARRRWGLIGAGVTVVIVGYCVWLVLTDAPAYQFPGPLYLDRIFLKTTLRKWGVLAPVIFITLQALQVIIAPIPGEITGILGGYLSVNGSGSSIPPSVDRRFVPPSGSALGWRPLRAHPRQPRDVGEARLHREAEGAILCSSLPHSRLPKDMVCYLFGMSPMPLGSLRWSRRLAASQAHGSCRHRAHTAAGTTLSESIVGWFEPPEPESLGLRVRQVRSRRASGPRTCVQDWKSCVPSRPVSGSARNQLDPITGMSAPRGCPRGGLTSDQSVEAANESSPRLLFFCRVSEGLPSHTASRAEQDYEADQCGPAHLNVAQGEAAAPAGGERGEGKSQS